MDNLTHTLTAVAMSHAGLNRKTRFATLALIIGANIADIDSVSRFDSSATYLEYHRGITHSLLGVIVLGALVAAAIYFLGRRARAKKTGPPVDARWLLVCSLIATGSHLLLDFTNAYGVRPFLPFSGRWYAWDIMFIIDPLLLTLLALGLGLPWLFRLISEEVGARKPSYQRGAIFALSSMVLLWGLRDFAYRRVLSLLDSHTYLQETPRRLGAFPTPVNPFLWTGVVETDSVLHVLAANALADDVDATHTRVFRKEESTPPLEAALRTRTAKIFLDFARFPWDSVAESEDGYDVTLRDLRFLSSALSKRGFVVDVHLDKQLRVRSESFSFSGTPQRGKDQEGSEEDERGTSGAGPSDGVFVSRR
ncbi:MAG: metal-dependent hydrolase [Acidobacteriia bacterium]|nr:metal-dependent hydrolase [Terriglobia bacterium]